MNIFISGIGGSGAYYLARYFLNLGYNVNGSDLQESARAKELLEKGAKITFNVTNTGHLNNVEWDLYIYSPALRDDHIEVVFFKNKGIKMADVGTYTDQLITDYSQNKLSETEKDAFNNSEIAPLFGVDWNKRKYIAITGTDGKTTTSSMVYHILNKLGLKAAMLTTLGLTVEGKNIDTGLHTTTPSSQELFKLLNSEELDDIEYVVLEVTSHGLAMGRVAGAKFDVAVITNITSEHLDYHKTWENYYEAKTRLFKHHLKENGTLVINPGDVSYSKLQQDATNRGLKPVAEIHNDLIIPQEIRTEYNVQNASLAVNAIQKLIPGIGEIPKDILVDFKSVKGRMEYLQTEPFTIIVDFAHTANALMLVLSNLRNNLKEGAKLRVVFGCAGMRDPGKRIPMGKYSAEFADAVYICPEDPRLEKLGDINAEILKGAELSFPEGTQYSDRVTLQTKDGKKVDIFQSGSIQDRYDAIEQAINDCAVNDILVICGKGHEKSLCFGTTEYDWSDQDAVEKILISKNE